MPEERVNLAPPAAPQSDQYIPPTELVPLPSLGLCYPAGHPLHNVQTVAIRSMTARDEDILTSRALLKSGKVISVLLRSCLVDKTIDADSLLDGDRNAILVAIRITGYGPSYGGDLVCEQCENPFHHDFDLSKLPIIRMSSAPAVPHQNVFAFTLPMLKKEVRFRLATGEDNRAIDETLAEVKKKTQQLVEEGVTTRLKQLVVSVGAAKEPDVLAKIIRNLPAGDSRALRKHMDKIAPGIDMRQTVVCPKEECKHKMEVTVPLGTEFFWPE